MKSIIVNPASGLRGELTVPGDKSISHRGVMFGAIAQGTTRLSGFLDSADCRSTINCFRSLGIDIDTGGGEVLVHGRGLHGLNAPASVLDVGNSGTTARLISGILCAGDFTCTLTGDSSIQKRPMKRIMDPLLAMGADISSVNNNGCVPLSITGRKLSGITWESPVASAQVKSCILLAGLYATGDTTVTEPAISRDHTERMLGAYGAALTRSGNSVTISPAAELHALDINIPGDISSAAYFIAAALICPGSELTIRNVNINPTRAGILKVIEQMGANFSLDNVHTDSGEECCDITIRSSSLHGTVIEGDIIPTLIDELPIIAVLGAFADGTTIIRDAAELKVKESDRIALISDNLSALGCDITPTEDGMIINGGRPLTGCSIRTASDHRIAMSFAVAALNATGSTTIDDMACVSISFPDFFDQLFSLSN